MGPKKRNEDFVKISQEEEGELVYSKFQCQQCGNEYKYEKHAKFKKESLQFYMLEHVYYIKDPFEDKSQLPIVLGGDCSLCGGTVCVSPKCSIFYTKRYCFSCVQENINSFPVEVCKEMLAANDKKS